MLKFILAFSTENCVLMGPAYRNIHFKYPCSSLVIPGLNKMVSADFEKDDDSNGHIDFIAAAAVSTYSSLSPSPLLLTVTCVLSILLSLAYSMKWNMFWGYLQMINAQISLPYAD